MLYARAAEARRWEQAAEAAWEEEDDPAERKRSAMKADIESWLADDEDD